MNRVCLIAFAMSLLVAGCGGFGRDDAATGAALYAANCAVCHGGDAQGGGGAGVAGLSKTPPDLTRLSVRNGGTFPATDTLEALQGYAMGGMRGRQMTGFSGLQSDQKTRVKLEEGRLRTTEPLAELLQYLQALQRP